MKHRYASDCHSHSDCSFDGRSSMEDMCCRAEEIGLYYYTLSDHCECNKYRYAPRHESGYCQVAQKAWEQMGECRERHPQLRLLKGIELGQPLQDLPAAEDALAGRDYDFVIGSLHNVAGEKDFYHLGGENMAPDRREKLLSQYFEEILQMIRWGNFDSLAHIAYPLRYLPGGLEGHWEEAEAVFSALIQSGRALELNTSLLAKPNAPHLPDLEIFTRYHRLGGRLVTLGADAHCTEDLAQGIDMGMELLKQAGFTEFSVFVKRRPVALPLK